MNSQIMFCNLLKHHLLQLVTCSFFFPFETELGCKSCFQYRQHVPVTVLRTIMQMVILFVFRNDMLPGCFDWLSSWCWKLADEFLCGTLTVNFTLRKRNYRELIWKYDGFAFSFLFVADCYFWRSSLPFKLLLVFDGWQNAEAVKYCVLKICWD